ncbi:MAG TPA: hypothetical protein DCM40_23395, partial [Maribacter sp.]|nr:hypothetical protein [Maribacter sp.]
MNFYTIFADGRTLMEMNMPEEAISPFTKNVEFAEVEDKLDITKDRGDSEPTIKVDRKITPQKTISVTELETFLATLNLTDMFQPQGGQISNLNLTTELFESAKNFSMDDQVQDFFRANSTFITVDENDDYAYTKPGFDMQKMLLSVIFVGKLRKMAKRKLRTYTDILQGKTNYSETVMYVVHKSVRKTTVLGPGAGVNQPLEVIQTYYFLNTSKTDVLKFIDTQVNYDVEYRYDIEAIVLSLGSNYIYQDPQKLVMPNREGIDFSAVSKYMGLVNSGNNPEGTESIPQMDAGGRATGRGRAGARTGTGATGKIHVEGQPGA